MRQWNETRFWKAGADVIASCCLNYIGKEVQVRIVRVRGENNEH